MTPLVNKVASLLQPLADFYKSAGQAAPRIEAINGEHMPQPYRGLLVHTRDMTPTLETFWGRTIHLQPLQVREDKHVLYRQVLLVTDVTEKPVEFGAIKIFLDRFSEAAQHDILSCRLPLGTILREHGIAHHSRPSGFFRLAAEAVTREAFDLNGSPTLYGRHNVLYDSEDQPLADVVEILPPVEDRGEENSHA